MKLDFWIEHYFVLKKKMIKVHQFIYFSVHIFNLLIHIMWCSSFLYLRRVGSIGPYLTEKATACLINSVTSCLDFCSTSTSITSDQMNRLQRVQNCSTRLIAKKRKHEHITPVLTGLHWLPLEFCTNWLFWLSVISRVLFLYICLLFCTFVNHHAFFAHFLKNCSEFPG